MGSKIKTLKSLLQNEELTLEQLAEKSGAAVATIKIQLNYHLKKQGFNVITNTNDMGETVYSIENIENEETENEKI